MATATVPRTCKQCGTRCHGWAERVQAKTAEELLAAMRKEYAAIRFTPLPSVN